MAVSFFSGQVDLAAKAARVLRPFYADVMRGVCERRSESDARAGLKKSRMRIC